MRFHFGMARWPAHILPLALTSNCATPKAARPVRATRPMNWRSVLAEWPLEKALSTSTDVHGTLAPYVKS